MVFKNILFGSCLGLVSCLAANPSTAQFTLATQTDQYLSSSAGIHNTGCDVVPFSSANVKAFCWDGASPGIAVEYNGTVLTANLQSSAAVDPDIVIDPRSLSTQGQKILVVYEVSGAIYYEGWEFDGLQLLSVQTPILIYSNMPATCSNANVDVTTTGEIMFTFNNGFNSFGIAGADINVMPLLLSPAYTVDIPCIQLCNSRFPDVKISFDHDAEEAVASFTYIYSEGDWVEDGPKYLAVVSAPISAFFSGPPFSHPCPEFETIYNSVGTQHHIGPPRISGPPELVFHTMDYQVVARTIETSNDFEYIRGFNKSISTSGLPNTLSQNILNVNANDPFPNTPSHQLVQCTNEDPVVTSSFDHTHYQSAWSFYKASVNCPVTPGASSPSHDIITRKLDYNGVKFYNDYSVANTTLSGQQRFPSVAGRFNPSNEFLYMFVDDSDDIFFKSVPVASQSLKRATEQVEEEQAKETPVNVLRNEVLFVQTTTRVQLFTLQGQMVIDQVVTAGDQLRLEGVSSGLYLLREVSTNAQSSSRKIWIP